MSTAMASLDDNTGGRYYAYRCSKVTVITNNNKQMIKNGLMLNSIQVSTEQLKAAVTINTD
jgi:hypothetical protein